MHKRLTFKLKLVGTIFLLMSQVSFATDFTVSSSADSGVGSLRTAITSLNAASGSTITSNSISFDPGISITLLSDLPVITKGATIGGNAPTINGNSFRIFATSGADISLINMTLQNGLAQGGTGCGGGLGAGGSIYIDIGRQLTLINVTVQNSTARGGAGAATGATIGGGGASFSILSKNGTAAGGGGDFPGIDGGSGGAGAGANKGTAGYGGGTGGSSSGAGGTPTANAAGINGSGSNGGNGGYCAGGGSGGSSGGGGGGGNTGGNGSTGGGGGGYGSGGGGGNNSNSGGGGGGFGGGGGSCGDLGFSGGGGGGFGGGGGSNANVTINSTGGSYGGNGAQNFGGGGAGIGGAVFVSDGVSLFIEGVNSMTGGTVTGGAAGGGTATPGQGIAPDIFLFRGASITFTNNTSVANPTVGYAIQADPLATGTNKDSGVSITPSSGALTVTLTSPSNNYQGNTTINSNGTLNAGGTNLPGTNVSTPGNIIVNSGGTFGLTSGTFPTNTLINNNLGGIVNVAGAFAPLTASINAGTMNINTGGVLTKPATYTNTGRTNINGTGNISGAFTGNANSILSIGDTVAANYTTSGTIIDIEVINVVTSGSTLTVNNAVTGVADQFTIAAGTTVNLNANFAGTATTPASFNSGTLNLASSFGLAGFTNNSSGNIFFTTGTVNSTPLINNGTITISNDSSSTAGITNNNNFIVNANLNMSGQALNSTNGTVTISAAGGVSSATYNNSFIHNMTIVDATTFGNINSTGAVNLTGSVINVTSSTTTSGTWPIITSGPGLLTRPEGNANINLPTSSSGLFSAWSAMVTSSAVIVSFDFVPFVGFAQGAFNIEVAGVLDQMAANIINSGQQQLISLFRNSSSVQELNTSLHELMPIANSLQLNLEMQNTVYNKVEARIASADHNLGMPGIATGINVGDLTPSSFMWLSASGSLTNQGHVDLNDGYNAKTGVFLLGADSVKCNQVVGVAAGYSISRINELSNAGFATDTQRYHGLVYGTLSNKEKNYVDWLVTGSFNTNDSHRSIAVAGVGLNTQSDYNGYQFGARATTGKPYEFWESYQFTPLTYIQYSYLNQDDYNEAGSIAALHVSEISQNIVTLGVGAKFAFPLDAWKLIGMRELRASVSYDVLHPNNITTANFLVGSNTFDVYSTPQRISYKLGAGMTFEFCKSFLSEINYDFEYRTGFTDHTLLAKVKYVF